MSWKKDDLGTTDPPRSIPLWLKLSLTYGMIFTLVSSLSFTGVCFALKTILTSEMDAQLREEVQRWESVLKLAGLRGLENEFVSQAFTQGARRCFCRYTDERGLTMAASNMTAWQGLPSPPLTFVSQAQTGDLMFATLTLTNQRHIRVAYLKVNRGVLAYGLTAESINNTVLRMIQISVISVIGMAILAGGLGYLGARRSLRGLDTMVESIEKTGIGQFEHPMPKPGDSLEVDRLVDAFDRMRRRISSLVDELRNVTNDIAHDLRSPITRIRGTAETTLMTDHQQDQSDEALGTVVEECDRLIEMINSMLSITQLDALKTEDLQEEIDLTVMVRQLVDIYDAAAEDAGPTLVHEVPETTVLVRGRQELLARAVTNLLDNALKFTPTGGMIKVIVSKEKTQTIITVADNGPGLSAEDQQKVFNRFYRGDSSRGQPGNGLGLAMVKGIAKAHQGQATVTSTPGEGSSFCLSLPDIIQPNSNQTKS